MSQESRNDAKAKRLIEFLYIEGVSPENIARLLNHHFTETYTCIKQSSNPTKQEIQRVPEGHNWAPSVTVWRQA